MKLWSLRLLTLGASWVLDTKLLVTHRVQARNVFFLQKYMWLVRRLLLLKHIIRRLYAVDVGRRCGTSNYISPGQSDALKISAVCPLLQNRIRLSTVQYNFEQLSRSKTARRLKTYESLHHVGVPSSDGEKFTVFFVQIPGYMLIMFFHSAQWLDTLYTPHHPHSSHLFPNPPHQLHLTTFSYPRLLS